ncbi:Mce-associated membrane protein [Rhodococcus sp. 27YEA15]|uniref:hypothetical protein n=1 Tax=Rhodococcus sp. 27YEA15 TaxID=3156259 RepID=UPI003C799D0D
MPPKRRQGGPGGQPNRRPKIAGSNRSSKAPARPSDGEPSAPIIAEPSESEATGTQTAVPAAVPGSSESPDTETRESNRADPTPPDVRSQAVPRDPDVGPVTGNDSVDPDAATAPSWLRWRTVAIVGAVALVVAALAVVSFLKVGAQRDDVAWVNAGETTEVMRVTQESLAAVFTYAPDTFDADFDKGLQGLTQSMRDELSAFKDSQKAGVEQTRTATTADVALIGVTRLEKDRAQLLAQLNVSSTQNGVASDSRSGMVMVSVEKVGGDWQISGIKDQ